MPSHWFFARVLWADAQDILTEHAPPCRQPPICRQVLGYDSIIAAGEFEQLSEYKERCRKAVAELSAKVHDAESALGAARDAVWTQIDEMHLINRKQNV